MPHIITSEIPWPDQAWPLTDDYLATAVGAPVTYRDRVIGSIANAWTVTVHDAQIIPHTSLIVEIHLQDEASKGHVSIDAGREAIRGAKLFPHLRVG